MDRKTKKIVDSTKARIEGIAHGLCQRPVSTFDEYKRLVGEYGGLKFVLDQILSGEKEDD